jgi:hypothetical protein
MFKKENKEPQGVAFDQHYTASLLRIVSGTTKKKQILPFKTKRSIPKKEVLTTLLLFGKAYLSRSSWFYPEFGDVLSELHSEGLCEWIPVDYETKAYTYLSEFIDRAGAIDFIIEPPIIYSLDTVTGKFDSDSIEGAEQDALDRYKLFTEKEFDIDLIVKNLTFLEPVLKANLNHLGFDDIDYKKFFDWNTFLIDYIKYFFPDSEELQLSPEERKDIGYYHSILDEMQTFNRFTYDLLSDPTIIPIGYNHSLDSLYLDADENIKPHIASLFSMQSAVFNSSIASYSVDRFCSDTGYPLKSTASSLSHSLPKITGNEEYTLIRIQYNDLRYPVIEDIKDVLRLRDNRYLRTYRKVIFEYSSRLRAEIESERSKIVKEFKNDLKLATDDLRNIGKWTTMENVCFYISIPLAVAGVMCGLPLSDMFIIPATLVSKIITRNERKKADWILFGK